MFRLRLDILFCVAGVLLSVGCNRPQDRTESSISNSPFSILNSQISTLLLRDQLDSAMHMVDSVDATGALSPYNASMLRIRIYTRGEATVRLAQAECEKLLQERLTDNQRMAVLEQLVYVSRLRRDDEQTLRYAIDYIQSCRDAGQTTRALTAQAETAALLIRIGRTDEGLGSLDEVIAQLDGIRRFTEADACILAMKSKIRSLIDLERYDEAVPLCERIIGKLQDIAARPDFYNDGSVRMPKHERLDGYVDFYTGQACSFAAHACAAAGHNEQAWQYSRRFDQTDYSKTYAGRKLMASTWALLGQYERMEKLYDEMETMIGDDTVHHDFAVDLYYRAFAADAQGHKAQAANYWKRYASIIKQINQAERIAAAEESIARYHELERQLELEKVQAKERRDILIVWTLICMLAVIIAFAITIHKQLKDTKRKNAILSNEIAGHIAFKDKYIRLMAHPEIPIEQKDEQSIQRLNNMSDSELFDFLRVVIVGEQLYTNPLFDRQLLMTRFGLSKDRIGAAFSKGSPYGSLPAYINECRMNASAWLLREKPDMTIADIATACGYSNTSTFNVQFRNRYSLSPTEFRHKE